MDVATLHDLLSPAGQDLLAEAESLVAADVDALAAGDRLRRHAAPALAAAAMTQAVLRRTAADKLGADAAAMYFTADGLEQSTRWEVAAHRAARLAFAAPASVVDLGCGIGGDLVQLARSGIVTAGVDLDPVRAAIAAANLDALGLPGAVRLDDATTLDLDVFGAAFADPARRGGRGRVFDVDAYVPPWSFVERLLTAPGRASLAKVAPGVPHERVPEGVETEIVSFRGEVKEAVLWSPRLATARRRATLVRGPGLATLTDADDPGPGASGPVGAFLAEPDGAVIRAGLVTAVSAALDGWLLDEHLAYVATDRGDLAAATPYARAYRVLEELPYTEKRLRAALRERGIGRLTIKKRGVDVVPEQLRRRLALRGDREATLVLTRVQGRGTALLVEPLARR